MHNLNTFNKPMRDHSSVAVVHLLWQGTPVRHLKDFLASLDENPAGRDHDLLIIFKGCNENQKTDRLDLLGNRPFIALDVPDSPSDLSAYFQAVEQTDYDFYCFLNSYSVILAQDWLQKLAHALTTQENAGVAHCSGSWEQSSHKTAFPNYHIRTNGFLIARDLLLSLDRGDLTTRAGALGFEAGQNSLTQQILRRGLEPLVVDRHGQAWRKEDWQRSETFRSGQQKGLMLQDNRTRAYDEADALMQKYLETLAWSDLDPGPNPQKRHKLSHRLKTIKGRILSRNQKRFPG